MQKETKVCERCGAEYEAYVWFGKPRPVYQTLCRACAVDEAERIRREEFEAELERAVSEQRLAWWLECGIPPLFSNRKTLSNFVRNAQPKAFDAVNGYDYTYNEDDGAARSLVLLSPNAYGVGKTHLACGLAGRILETAHSAVKDYRGLIRRLPCPVYFTTEAKLLSRIRRTFNDGASETDEDIYQQLQNVELLIIDDVGKVRPRDTSFLQSVYFRVIDDRYTSENPVILTTNLDYAELEAHIGGASADRLREMCGKDGFLKLAGKSYRHKE